MTHTLTTHFRKLLTDLRPPEDRLELAKTLPGQVREFLQRHEDFITKSPHSRLAGSYAQFLSVGDVKDVDFLVRVDGDPDADDPTARSVLSALAKALKDLPEHLGYVGDSDFDFMRNRRSVQVKFETEDFYLDVVPCIAPYGLDNPIYVPDWGYESWIESHPLGVVQLIEDLEAEHPGKFRSLARLFKKFRNHRMKYMRPKSYWLVALTIKAVRSGAVDTNNTLAEAFDQLLTWIYDTFEPYLDDEDAVPEIADPMLGHNVAHNWDRHDFIAFMDRLDEAKGWTASALASPDKDAAIQLWKKVFGDEFPNDAEVERFAEAQAASWQPGISHVATSGVILPAASSTQRSVPVQPTKFYGKEK